MACGDRGGGRSVNRSLFSRNLNFDPLEVGGLGHVTRCKRETGEGNLKVKFSLLPLNFIH